MSYANYNLLQFLYDCLVQYARLIGLLAPILFAPAYLFRIGWMYPNLSFIDDLLRPFTWLFRHSIRFIVCLGATSFFCFIIALFDLVGGYSGQSKVTVDEQLAVTQIYSLQADPSVRERYVELQCNVLNSKSAEATFGEDHDEVCRSISDVGVTCDVPSKSSNWFCTINNPILHSPLFFLGLATQAPYGFVYQFPIGWSTLAGLNSPVMSIILLMIIGFLMWKSTALLRRHIVEDIFSL